MKDERALIERAQAGDHDAFLDLVARYDRQIMSVVYRFTYGRFDREDLYQEVFLHCYRSIRRFRFRSSFRTWLYRLALNRSVTFMRKRQPVVAASREEQAPAVDWERREKLGSVHRALSRLKGRQRVCFHLHYVEGWRVDEIAAVLGCSEGTVKSHLNRARGKIRRDSEVVVWLTST